MRFVITADSNQESGVSDVLYELSGPTRQHFLPRDYGSGLPQLGVVLMCRDPHFNFKRRVRFSRKDQALYMDVMLHLPDMIPLTHDERRRVIVQRLLLEIPEVLTKYAFRDFDQPGFESDLRAWLSTFAA